MKLSYKEIKDVKSVEEILAITKAKGGEISKEEAETLLRDIKKYGELPDDKLDEVTGGTGWWTSYDIWKNPKSVVYKFQCGQHVEAIRDYGWLTGHVYTKGCVVIERDAKLDRRFTDYYVPYYLLSSDSTDFNGRWIAEHDIEGGYDLIVSD